MKKIITTLTALSIGVATSQAALVIAGVIDGDLTGGNPKAIVLQATSDIADLSTWGIGSANNGGGSDGEEFTFSGSISSGVYIIATGNSASTTFFTDNFGGSNYTAFETGDANINGDDAIELFSGGFVVDTYGDIDVYGDGETWDYSDGYAVRTSGTAGTFDQANYASNAFVLDTLDETQQADILGSAFNDFNFSAIPEPSSTALLGLGGLALILLRRR
jgi:hypothetical protein